MKAITERGRLTRRLTYANVVATLALVIAIGGGSAYAASRLITGKQIAKGTITAGNIKKSTLTSGLFKRGALKAGPRGSTGAAGPAGPTGATGASGATGAPGAAGSALAYGVIENNANGNLAFVSGVTKGFTTVYSPSAGYLCIAVPAGAANVPLEVTDASNEPGRWEDVSTAQCGGSGYEVANVGSGGTALAGALVVSVPQQRTSRPAAPARHRPPGRADEGADGRGHSQGGRTRRPP